MSKLYEFEIEKEEEVLEKTQSKDDQGADITVEKKVKKAAKKKFYLLKPTRTIREEASLYYASQLATAIRRGLVTNSVMTKLLEEDQTLFKKTDAEKLATLYVRREELNKEVVELAASKEGSKKERDAEKEKLLDKIAALEREIRQKEADRLSVYDSTAETFAQNKTLVWYLLNLSHSEDNKKFFKGENLESQLNSYDEISDNEDPFIIKVKDRFVLATTLFVYGGYNQQSQFDEFIKANPI